MAAIPNSFSIPQASLPRINESYISKNMAAGNALLSSAEETNEEELHRVFADFVGQTFFGQMMKAMRSTVGKAAYFDGGRAEKVFQSQLDQNLAEHMSKASAKQFSEPMFQRQFPHLTKQPSSADAMLQLKELPRR